MGCGVMERKVRDRPLKPNELAARAIISKLQCAAKVNSNNILFFAIIERAVRDYCDLLNPKVIKGLKVNYGLKQRHRDAARLAEQAERFFRESLFEQYCDFVFLDADYARKIIFHVVEVQAA